MIGRKGNILTRQCLLRIVIVQCIPESTKSLDAGCKCAEALKLCDDDAHGHEHLSKSSCRLRHHPKLHRSPHVHGTHDDQRQDEGDVVVTAGKKTKVSVPTDNTHRIDDDFAKAG